MFGLITLVRNSNKTDRLAEQIVAIQARRDQDRELIKQQQEEIERLREVSEQLVDSPNGSPRSTAPGSV